MRFTTNVFLNGVFYPCGAEYNQHREDVSISVEKEKIEVKQTEVEPEKEAKKTEPKKLSKMEIFNLKADEAKELAPEYGISPELSGAAIKRALNEKFGY